MWKRIGRTASGSTRGRRRPGGCGRRKPRRLFLEFLWDTRVGCRVSPGRVRVEEVKGVEGVLLSEGEEGGPGPP